MANSAFDHTAAITVPGSSTNTGVVTWSGTGANTFSDSTVLVSGGNITIPGTITFGGTQITSTAAELNLLDGVSGLVQADLTKLAAIDATAAEINLLDALDRGSILYGNASGATAVLGQGSNGQVLTSDGTDISWAAASGTTINNNADNRVITGSGTANTLNGESGLTFDGRLLSLIGDGGGYSAVYIHQTSTSSGRKAFLRLRTESSAGGAADPEISFETNGGTSWQVGIDNSQSDRFVIANTGDIGTSDKIRFDTGAAGSDVTVVAGNLVIGTAGKGIDFSAQSSPASGMTSELLDHYEEGTWTPTLTFGASGNTGITYSAQVGTYTKIGRYVSCQGRFTLTSKGSSSGNARIHGLPFAVAGGIGDFTINYGYKVTFGDMMNGYVVGPNQIHLMNIPASNGVAAYLFNTHFSNDSFLNFSVSYSV